MRVGWRGGGRGTDVGEGEETGGGAFILPYLSKGFRLLACSRSGGLFGALVSDRQGSLTALPLLHRQGPQASPQYTTMTKCRAVTWIVFLMVPG